MTHRQIPSFLWIGVVFAAFSWGVVGAEEPTVTAGLPTYEKKSTWAETMRSLRVPVEEEAEPTAPELGPWFTTGSLKSERFDEALVPEKGVDLEAKGDDGRRLWEAHRDWADGRPHDLPSDGTRGATYLYRTIRVEQSSPLPVGLGSDDGLLVWLNGEEVLRRDVARGVGPNQDQAVLQLQPGENRLLLKIYNQGGGHGFYFSTDPIPQSDLLGELWKRIEADFPIECGWMRRHLGGQAHLGYFDFHRDAELERRMIDQALRECGREGMSLRGRFEALVSTGAGPDDPRWLALYEETCLFRHRPDALRQVNLRALRLAIEDLSGGFGGRYAKGREYLARLEQIEREVARIERDLAGGDQGAAGRAAGVIENFRRLQQEALLANPLLEFGRLLVVPRAANKQHGLPQNWQGNCALPRNGYDNRIAVLSPIRPDGNLTTLYQPDAERFVGDIDLHFDGRKMLFSMPDNSNRWQVWEIGVDGSGLRQVTPGEDPDVDNYDACYLPDGRILFASTRCFQGVPCVGGGNTVANLCIMNADGTGIRQMCFDQDHNWGPTVLNDGRVLYSRWEYSDTPHYFSRLLFRMNPDGTSQMQYYGSNSHWPNSLFYAKPIPNHPTKVVAVISGHHGVPRMGELVLFDPARGRRQADGAVQRIPGHGVKVEPVIGDGIVDGSWPKFLHPYPLSDKYFLVSMKRNQESDWGIYLVDVFDNLVPVKEEAGWAMLHPVPMRSRPRPPVIPDRVNLDSNEATVYLNDVYFGEGLAGVPRGTVKSLRLYEFHYAYPGMGGHIDIGIDGPWDARRILGTVPVEADGSAAFKVPANVPIAVQPLDDRGRAVQVMRSWFTAMPGEVVSCTGCHEDLNTAPPPKPSTAMLRKPSAIAPWRGPARPFSFRREVQPVLDRHCVGCHDGKEGNRPNYTIDRPSPERRFTPSYVDLHRFVRRPGPESDYALQRPMEFHASTSELVQMLEKGHHGVALDAEAWDRLVTWIDLNVPDHGTWTEQRGGQSHWVERRLETRTKYANRPENPEEYPTPPPETPEFLRPETPPERRPQTFQMTGWPFDAAEAERRREALGLPKELTVELAEGLALELVLIPPGEFVMGAHDGLPDEYPQARVVIDKPFYLGRFEVTNAQYALLDAGHDSAYISVYNKDHSNRGQPVNRDRQPVVRVSWRQAMDYCQWLSQTTGRRFTLPTEAQWEYACRAGTPSPMWYGETRTDFGKLANLADSRLSELTIRDSPKWIPSVAQVNDGAIVTEQVGKYQANAFGLFDTHGNAGEWTRTEYRPYPYNAGDGREQPSARGSKVVRGGSFYDRPERARSAARRSYPFWQQVFDVGFRVAMEVEP